jgi:hypothetical protein
MWKYRGMEEMEKNSRHLKLRNTMRRKWMEDGSSSEP